MIADPGNPVFVSAVSAWEVAVKKGLGKLEAPADFEDQVNTHRYEPLDITIAHAWAVESLPMLHKDPFDRLLVAQAMLESLTIVTRDRNIARYDVSVVPA
jgi:PIN domain nuclease of toxin-antitoxin system